MEAGRKATMTTNAQVEDDAYLAEWRGRDRGVIRGREVQRRRMRWKDLQRSDSWGSRALWRIRQRSM